MNDFLTTDELLKLIEKSRSLPNERSKERHPIHFKRITYVSIAVLAVLHLVYIAIPLVFQEQTKDIIGYQYVVAIQQNQTIDNELDGRVVKLEQIDDDALAVGDHVLVYGLYSTEYYWELVINSIDYSQEIIYASYDNIITNAYTRDQIEGRVGENANVIGIAYYTASSLSGFLYMTLFHLVVLSIIYYVLFKLTPIKNLRKKS